MVINGTDGTPSRDTAKYRKGAKVVPRAHREKKLVSSDSDATYVIRRALKDAFRTTVLGAP